MATMNISLPDNLRIFVEEQVKEGGYSTASEYFRELIRTDQQRKAKQKLEELLLAGLESGQPIPITTDYVNEKLAKLVAQHNQKKQVS